MKNHMEENFFKDLQLESFLNSYRVDISNISCSLESIPGVAKNKSILILISRFVPWWMINKLLSKPNKYKDFNIGIIKHVLFKPYIGILHKFPEKSTFIKYKDFYLLKLIAYKFITEFKINKSASRAIYKLKNFFEITFSHIMIPYDSYPETFFLTQLLRYSNIQKTLTVCLQHGTPVRSYEKKIYKQDNVIQDGMNSDIFCCWNEFSSDLMKSLVKKNTFIKRNKNLKTIILRCIPHLHSDGSLEDFKKNKTIREKNNRKKNVSWDKQKIIFLQTYRADDYYSLYTDKIYQKIIFFLKEEKKLNKLKLSYKLRLNSNIPNLLKDISNLCFFDSKKELFSDISNSIFFTGQTSLAFELNQAGAFVVGLPKTKYEMKGFPREVFNQTHYIDQKTSNKELREIIFNVLKEYKNYKNSKKEPAINCFIDPSKCISSEELINQILAI